MRTAQLQRRSVRLFHALGRQATRLGEWIRARPRLAAWVFRSEAEVSDEAYSENNRWVFAQHGEQERMLADGPRMKFYRELVRRHVQAGDRVIDLGTGTGILAAFASWQGAARVYALDHSTILDDARLLAEHNGIERVEFISAHSRKFMLEERVDVILHEQMGDMLFDEDMVNNVLDLRDRLLREGGRILPARFELYCEPVQLRNERAVPFIWELNVDGYDYSPLADRRDQDPGYYHYSETDQSLVAHFLCEPIPLLTLDLHTLRREELSLSFGVVSEVVKAGRMDGYAVFFRALVDDDLVLSTSPLDPGRAPHWGYHLLRTERMRVAVGDILDITIEADNWAAPDSWRWEQAHYTADEYRDCQDEGEFDDDEWDEDDQEADEDAMDDDDGATAPSEEARKPARRQVETPAGATPRDETPRGGAAR